MEILRIFGFVYYIAGTTMALRGLRINVPAAVVRGKDAHLQCNFDLENDQLYSVKWYFDYHEFYRYTPNERPPIKQFRTKTTGLKVRESESNANRIVLEHVPNNVSGDYMCEVTADQPSFFTVIKSSHLKVVDLPHKDPYITGLKTRYSLGDILKANCTSEHSNPLVNLTWYINGNLTEHPHVSKHSFRSLDNHYYNTHSVVRLQITKQLYAKGRLKIRCVASMYDIYYCSNEKSVELKKRRHDAKYHNLAEDVGAMVPVAGMAAPAVPSLTTTTTRSPATTEPPEPPYYVQVESHPQATLVFQSPEIEYNGGNNNGVNGNRLDFLSIWILLFYAATLSILLR